jgi:solute carrier family 13 (sodium-dependent dicarboxylate transporter), member 2/3/5
MATTTAVPSGRRERRTALLHALPPLGALALGAAGAAVLEGGTARVAALLAAACLALWLAEWTPPFVPGLALVAAIPLALGGAGSEFALDRVLAWAADPVLALFFGGFALGAAAATHGVDARIAAIATRWARGRRERLMLAVLAGTAALSMWMSNVAAAAMMIAALRPLLAPHAADTGLRTGLLLALAAGANFGGMATPVGTGPNAIALAALERTHPVSFAQWMALGVPLAAALLVAAATTIRRRYGLTGPLEAAIATPRPVADRPPRVAALAAIFTVTVALWLAEPLHGIAPPTSAGSTGRR